MKGANDHVSKGAASGLVALVFLILGFQLAIFVTKVIDRPRMNDVTNEKASSAASGDRAGELVEIAGRSGRSGRSPVDTGERDENQSRVASKHQSPVASGKKAGRLGGYERPATDVSKPARTYESFPFDPNTVSLEDLQRLGLTLRQAETIENYRSKGGRFRSKDDFRKMYVVSDTLFTRLEPFIKIPKVELNAADSAALVSLRGIGPYYAHKILEYRERLGGFLYKAQLLEIEGLDEERLAGFSEDIEIDTTLCNHLDLWNATESALARHPYLGAKGARSIARYKSLYDTTRWTLADLEHERVLPKENIEKLKKYIEIQ
jgi:DNA uptake protein ComE-like DNA-binding protein